VAVQGFLLESFGAAGDHGVVGDSVTVRQVLDRQAGEIERRSGKNATASRADPVQTEMLHVLADGYERLGALEEAERWAQRAVAVRRADEPAATRDLARSVGLLGWIQHERSDLDPAEANLRASLALWRDVETDSVGLSRALNDLGAALSTRGDLEESEAMLQEALSIRRSIYLPSDRAIAITLNNLASTLSLQARTEEALTLYQMAATSLESSLGPDHPRTLLARLNVAGTHGLLGDYEVWAEQAGEVSATFDRLGRTDAQAGRAHESYGRALGFLGRFDESQAAVERALAIFQAQLGDHLLTARAQYFMATLRNAMRRRDESLEYARASVATFRKVLDGDHPELAEALRLVGTQATSRPEQIDAYREASEMLTRIEGEDGAGAVRLTLSLARALVADRQFEEALEAFQALARSVPVAYGDDHAYAPAPYLGMAEALLGMNERGAAENALETAREKLVGNADVATNRAWVTRLESAVAASRAQGARL
jgi:tetratricopeptide (TPR) repeat protein